MKKHQKMRKESEPVTENMVRSDDGVYHWMYEFPMLKNPVLLFAVYKVLLISFGIVYLFIGGLALFDGNGFDDFLKTTGVFAIIILAFLLIGVIAYFILAAVYGWKYIVLFEMDDEKVVHCQMPRQFDRAQGLAWIATFAGVLTGNITGAGQGLLAASKQSSISTWKDVTKVRVNRNKNTIYVNQPMSHNQIYVDDADFDFVEQFVRSHCINAEIK